MTQRLGWVAAGRARTAIVPRSSGAAASYAADAIPPNTLRTYEGAWRRFTLWCELRRHDWHVPNPQVLAQHIGELAESGKSPATIEVALSAIGQKYVLRGHKNPRESPEVQLVRKGIRNRHGTAQKGKDALGIEVLRDIVRSITGSKPIDVRDRALLLVGFGGAFRRSELVALDWTDIEIKPEGLTITLRRGKRDQQGKGRLIGIARGESKGTDPVRALTAWYDTNGVSPNGAIFRSIRDSGRIGGRLSSQSVGLILKSHLDRLGYDSRGYGAHSLRHGFVTAAHLAGKSRTSIKRQTGHKSDEMVDRYVQPLELFDDNPSEGIGL